MSATESFGKSSHRCIMRVCLIVALLDDFTGQPIKGSNARVWIENAKPPIKKDDGRFIFIDLPDGEHTVKAEGGTYCACDVGCTIAEGRAESITLRLQPNSLYPTPPDCVRIEGRCEPGEEIALYSADKSKAYKLLTEVKKGASSVGIYHPDNVNIEGKLLRIISGGKNSEFIRIKSLKDCDNAEYQLFDAVKYSYPKVGTILAEASEVRADAKGNFTVLLKSGSSSGSIMVCESLVGKGRRQEFEIEGNSRYMKIDFTNSK